MKNTSDRFDVFVKNTIQNPDSNILPPDWDEMEALLKHDHKPISANINKKSLLVAMGIIIVTLIILGILKWTQYSPSLSEKTELPTDTAEQVLAPSNIGSSLLIAETSQNIIQIDTLPKTEIDSITLVYQKQKSDSLTTNFKKKQAEEEKQKPKTEENSLVNEIIKKTKNKNLNVSSLAPTISDSDNLNALILHPDTAGKKQQYESKKNVAVQSDSLTPILYIPKSKKGKKQKPLLNSAKVLFNNTSVNPDSLR